MHTHLDNKRPTQPPVEQPRSDHLFRFMALFSGRRDTHARMWHRKRDGAVGYAPVHQALDTDSLSAHLRGKQTLGVYLLRADSTCRMFVLDLDATKQALAAVEGDRTRTQALHQALHDEGIRLLRETQAMGLHPMLIDSGYKGRHLWFFLDRALPGEQVHRAAQALARALVNPDPRMHLEAFPKQGSLKSGGLGNLVKLPLGVHLRTGRRCVLLDEHGAPLNDPWPAIARWPSSPLPEPPAAPSSAPGAPTPQLPSAEPKAPAQVWTLADFELSDSVGPILRGCPMLRGVIARVLEDRSIDHQEAIVLKHSLGHLVDGARAVNFVYDHVPGFPATERVQSLLRGSPVSCKKIRERLPQHLAMRDCSCRFPKVAGKYPTPLRHLDGLKPRVKLQDFGELAQRYLRQRALVEEAERQLEALRGQMVKRLLASEERSWQDAQGRWSLEHDRGLPVLRWEPGS